MQIKTTVIVKKNWENLIQYCKCWSCSYYCQKKSFVKTSLSIKSQESRFLDELISHFNWKLALRRVLQYKIQKSMNLGWFSLTFAPSGLSNLNLTLTERLPAQIHIKALQGILQKSRKENYKNSLIFIQFTFYVQRADYHTVLAVWFLSYVKSGTLALDSPLVEWIFALCSYLGGYLNDCLNYSFFNIWVFFLIMHFNEYLLFLTSCLGGFHCYWWSQGVKILEAKRQM